MVSRYGFINCKTFWVPPTVTGYAGCSEKNRRQIMGTALLSINQCLPLLCSFSPGPYQRVPSIGPTPSTGSTLLIVFLRGCHNGDVCLRHQRCTAIPEYDEPCSGAAHPDCYKQAPVDIHICWCRAPAPPDAQSASRRGPLLAPLRGHDLPLLTDVHLMLFQFRSLLKIVEPGSVLVFCEHVAPFILRSLPPPSCLSRRSPSLSACVHAPSPSLVPSSVSVRRPCPLVLH